MFCCRDFYCVRIEPQCKHRSIEFLTTQTDQSKRDILIDYVLTFVALPFILAELCFHRRVAFSGTSSTCWKPLDPMTAIPIHDFSFVMNFSYSKYACKLYKKTLQSKESTTTHKLNLSVIHTRKKGRIHRFMLILF